MGVENTRFFLFPASLALILSLGTSACTSGPLSTAASMRIDVEVYKGPLSKDPHMQWAELVGLIREIRNVLTGFNDALIVVGANMEFRGDGEGLVVSPHGGGKRQTRVISEAQGNPSEKWCEGVDLTSSWGPDKYLGCVLLAQIHNDIEQLLRQLDHSLKIDQLSFSGQKPDQKTSSEILDRLGKASEFAIQLKVKAFYWAASQLPVPGSRKVRMVVTTFASIASEYANLFSSRADALILQLHGLDRKYLPLSASLRDTNPTDFPNLFTWNRAVAPAIIEEILLHPLTALTSEETTDRVRVFERLFADHYWSKVNTVHASGQGEVRMALIKDEIGNWNLKSFDSDAEELVKAYSKLGKSALQEAVRVLAQAASQGKSQALNELLAVAARASSGQFGGTEAASPPIDVDRLHRRAKERLDNLFETARAKEKELAKLPEPQRSQAVPKHQEQTLQAAKDILKGHAEVIEALQAILVPETIRQRVQLVPAAQK